MNEGLMELMTEENLLPSDEESQRRTECLGKLNGIVREFIKRVYEKKGVMDHYVEGRSFQLRTFGSYRLDVHLPGADMDTVLVVCRHVDRKDMFGDLYPTFKARKDVTDLIAVEEARVPVIKFSMDGASSPSHSIRKRPLWIASLCSCRLTAPLVRRVRIRSRDGSAAVQSASRGLRCHGRPAPERRRHTECHVPQRCACHGYDPEPRPDNEDAQVLHPCAQALGEAPWSVQERARLPRRHLARNHGGADWAAVPEGAPEQAAVLFLCVLCRLEVAAACGPDGDQPQLQRPQPAGVVRRDHGAMGPSARDAHHHAGVSRSERDSQRVQVNAQDHGG